jgi:hypothetical protein
MKVTVEISEKDMKEVLRYSGEKKKGPAITKFLATQLMLSKRRELTDQVMSGEWSVELPDWRETRAREREHDAKLWER